MVLHVVNLLLNPETNLVGLKRSKPLVAASVVESEVRREEDEKAWGVDEGEVGDCGDDRRRGLPTYTKRSSWYTNGIFCEVCLSEYSTGM